MSFDIGELIVAIIIIFLISVVIAVGINESSEYILNRLRLGDEVRTNDEYNEYFNDSFNGRIISFNWDRYTVRDIQGNEREFEKKWLIKIDRK
jgi:hypothetical protein